MHIANALECNLIALMGQVIILGQGHLEKFKILYSKNDALARVWMEI